MIAVDGLCSTHGWTGFGRAEGPNTLGSVI